jgi:hypothetical protein
MGRQIKNGIRCSICSIGTEANTLHRPLGMLRPGLGRYVAPGFFEYFWGNVGRGEDHVLCTEAASATPYSVNASTRPRVLVTPDYLALLHFPELSISKGKTHLATQYSSPVASLHPLTSLG